MSNKQSVANIIVGSIVLGLANAWLYTFQGLSFFETFAGYTILSFVVMLFLISFLPSRGKTQNKPARGHTAKNKAPQNTPRHTKANPEDTGDKDDRIRGEVKWYNHKKGYGFLRYGDEEVFFHRHAIHGNSFDFKDDAPVRFYLGDSKKGPQATDVWLDNASK